MNDLYSDYFFEEVAGDEPESAGADELGIDLRNVEAALADLRADFQRTGARIEFEEVDRAAARHALSIAETAELVRRAEVSGLLEERSEALRRFDDDPDLEGEREAGSLDVLHLYLKDIGRFPLLNQPEEIALARTMEAGERAAAALEGDSIEDEVRERLKLLVERGKGARRRFIASNLRLMFQHAQVRRNQGLDFLDLLQEGTLGLIRAVDKFDYRLGYKFSTYGTWWIKQAMDRALADRGRVIRLPVHVVERIRKIRNAERKLWFELGREPSVTDVALKTGFDPADIAFLRDVSHDVLSLDAPVGTETDALRLLDLVPDPHTDVEDEAMASILEGELAVLLEGLDDRERRVVELRYGVGDAVRVHTLEEVGRMLGVTRERVRQLQNAAIKKLRVIARANGLLAPVAS